MTDLDKIFAAMREEAPDPRLAAIGGLVLTGAATRRMRANARRHLAVTGALALCIGLGASLTMPQGARAEPAVGLNGLPANAPSALLMGMR